VKDFDKALAAIDNQIEMVKVLDGEKDINFVMALQYKCKLLLVHFKDYKKCIETCDQAIKSLLNISSRQPLMGRLYYTKGTAHAV